MNKTSSMVLAALLATAACGKGGGSGGGGGAKIDKAAFKALTDGIKQGDAWATTTASIDKVLGPVKVKRGTDLWIWAVDDGEDCWNIKLEGNGTTVMGWSGGSVNKLVERGYQKCVERSKGNDI
jgi:hypothetical protein